MSTSIDPKTVAIGGALVVAGVGAYLLLGSKSEGEGGRKGDTVDNTPGSAYPTDPYSDNPNLPEKERDDGIPIIGGLVGSLEDAKLKYWINDFRQKGYSDQIKAFILATRTQIAAKNAALARASYASARALFGAETDDLVKNWVPDHWGMADPLYQKNKAELDSLGNQLNALEAQIAREAVAVAKVDLDASAKSLAAAKIDFGGVTPSGSQIKAQEKDTSAALASAAAGLKAVAGVSSTAPGVSSTIAAGTSAQTAAVLQELGNSQRDINIMQGIVIDLIKAPKEGAYKMKRQEYDAKYTGVQYYDFVDRYVRLYRQPYQAAQVAQNYLGRVFAGTKLSASEKATLSTAIIWTSAPSWLTSIDASASTVGLMAPRLNSA